MRLAPQDQLAKRLADAGVELTHGISFGRADPYDDTTVRWETHGHLGKRRQLHILSYDTVTACARRGIIVSKVDDGMLWIDAKAPAPGRTPSGEGQ